MDFDHFCAKFCKICQSTCVSVHPSNVKFSGPASHICFRAFLTALFAWDGHKCSFCGSDLLIYFRSCYSEWQTSDSWISCMLHFSILLNRAIFAMKCMTNKMWLYNRTPPPWLYTMWNFFPLLKTKLRPWFSFFSVYKVELF